MRSLSKGARSKIYQHLPDFGSFKPFRMNFSFCKDDLPNSNIRHLRPADGHSTAKTGCLSRLRFDLIGYHKFHQQSQLSPQIDDPLTFCLHSMISSQPLRKSPNYPSPVVFRQPPKVMPRRRTQK